MRTALLLILCLVQAFPCFAASCQDMRDAVGSAMQQRNGRVSDTHNTMIPDPESERDALSGCLGSINALGDAFSLGVTLPGMDQIVAGMCHQVDSLIYSSDALKYIVFFISNTILPILFNRIDRV